MASMASIRSKNTRPEVALRRLIHAMGFRFRIHCSSLPGSPDIVFPSRRKLIFVHGCFWHRHRCKWGRKLPTGNPKYWIAKFKRNVSRDAADRRKLRRAGWQILIVWECQISDQQELRGRVLSFVGA
jgi:DNA mismatch endonuclease (patch repair protein)